MTIPLWFHDLDEKRFSRTAAETEQFDDDLVINAGFVLSDLTGAGAVFIVYEFAAKAK